MLHHLNIENPSWLLDYLENRDIITENTKVQITPLQGGVSNRTVKIDFEENSWVLKQALKKLRVKGHWFSAPERIYFEAEAMRWLNQTLPSKCPRLIFEDKTHYLLAMEAIKQPFENLKTLLLRDQVQTWLFQDAGTLLGQIHRSSSDSSKIPDLLFDTGFFQSLRIEPYYLETINHLGETGSFYRQLITDTGSDRFTFVHGDYSPKNLLLKKHQLILLDHEVAHYGDGTFDLGFFIAHLLSKANYRTDQLEQFINGIQVFFKAYMSQTSGMDQVREHRVVRHAIGCLLSRVCGLSKLEYLNQEKQQIQISIGLGLMKRNPLTINALTSGFKELAAPYL